MSSFPDFSSTDLIKLYTVDIIYIWYCPHFGKDENNDFFISERENKATKKIL